MPAGRASDRWGRVWVRCHGRYWQLQDAPASVWLNAAATPDMAGIWPGLVDDSDAADLMRLWLTEPDMQSRSILVARKALERAGQREWQWTSNMAKEIDTSWTQLNGRLVREGVRADRTSLPDYLDAAYTLFAELLKKEDFKALEVRLRKLSTSGPMPKPRMSSRADLMAFAKD